MNRYDHHWSSPFIFFLPINRQWDKETHTHTQVHNAHSSLQMHKSICRNQSILLRKNDYRNFHPSHNHSQPYLNHCFYLVVFFYWELPHQLWYICLLFIWKLSTLYAVLILYMNINCYILIDWNFSTQLFVLEWSGRLEAEHRLLDCFKQSKKTTRT